MTVHPSWSFLGLLLHGGLGGEGSSIPPSPRHQHLFFINPSSGLLGRRVSVLRQQSPPKPPIWATRLLMGWVGGWVPPGLFPTLYLALTNLRATATLSALLPREGSFPLFWLQPACPLAPGCPFQLHHTSPWGCWVTAVVQAPAEPGTSCPTAWNRRPVIELSLPVWHCSLHKPLKKKSMWFFLVPHAEGETSRLFCSRTLVRLARPRVPPPSLLPAALSPWDLGPQPSLLASHQLGVSFVLGVSQTLLKYRHIKAQFSILSNK